MKQLYLLLLILGNIGISIAQSINVYERPVQREPSHNFDVLHYKIALKFEGESRAFQGETTVTLRSLSDYFDNFALDAETYQVYAVKTSEGQPLSFDYQNGKLHIQLSKTFAYGDTLSVIVDYGTPRFEVNPEDFGMGANYPLGIGFFDANDEHPFLFNAYSFPTGARHWFPCYDHPNDRATHETIITTQGDHKVLANGLLQSVTKNMDGTITYHWFQQQAHSTYLYNFVSGPYEIIEDKHQDLSVNYWVYPQDKDKALRSFHRTPEILSFFEDYYGIKYPWDKYDQITVPGIGGGAEATTATLIGASTLHDEKAEPDFPSHWLVAHEVAHQWWGDFISYSDWTQTWLSESFATFSEYLYSNHLYGEEEGDLNLFNKRSAYLNEAQNRYQRPIVSGRWEYPDQNFDRHTYEKGALVLHMLRDYLGEPMFKRVLHHFLSKHAYQPVDTHDFMKSVWEVTGQNLDWFFEEWIFSAGHPILDISYEWKDQQIVLNVVQTQDTTQHIPIFKMPVKIAITTEKGTETKEVWLNEQQQTFTFDAVSKPLMLRFDPDHVLLKEWTFQKSKSELLYQAKHDNMLGRLWAAQQLAMHLNEPKVLNFLKSQAKTDPFWAVRREALQTLAQAKSLALTPTLQAALQDEHSRVRALATSLLGDSKQTNLHDLYKKLYETDPSYLVQAEAIRALGKLKHPTDQAFFEKVAEEKSPRNLLRNAANWALEQLKK